MKLFLLLVLPFALIECQFYPVYQPQFPSPLMYYNQMRSYPDPYLWFRYLNEAQTYNTQAADDDQDQELGENIVLNEGDAAQFRENLFVKGNQQDLPAARFFFNQGNAGLIDGSSSTFNFALKTLVHTTVSTKTVLTTSLCIPANLVGLATPCRRRRRDIEALLMPEPLEPSPTAKAETTALPLQGDPAESSNQNVAPIISSSKADGAELEEIGSGLVRAKRFFIARTTLTSYTFTTSVVNRSVTITAAVNGGACPPGAGALNCLLSCVPPGYNVC